MPLSPTAAAAKDRRTTATPMQHRHFAAIASIIATMGETRETSARHFADALARHNPNFDRARFLKAAGITP